MGRRGADGGPTGGGEPLLADQARAVGYMERGAGPVTHSPVCSSPFFLLPSSNPRAEAAAHASSGGGGGACGKASGGVGGSCGKASSGGDACGKASSGALEQQLGGGGLLYLEEDGIQRGSTFPSRPWLHGDRQVASPASTRSRASRADLHSERATSTATSTASSASPSSPACGGGQDGCWLVHGSRSSTSPRLLFVTSF